MRAILNDFFRAAPHHDALLLGGKSSIRLVGALRERRQLWAQRIFIKFFERKFHDFGSIDCIAIVPQKKRAAPSGLRLLCLTLGARHKIAFFADGLVKKHGHSQHGFSARERMDCEKFITRGNTKDLQKHILLIDDVETTGTSLLQAAMVLREKKGIEVRCLTLVKAGNCEEQNPKDKSG